MRWPLLMIGSLALAACASTGPQEVLRGDDLASRLSGQEIRISPPEGEDFAGLVFLARLRPDGTAEMSADGDGRPVEVFSDTERWAVRGQSLCVYDGAAPEASDCIRVDWVSDNRIQLTERRPSGAMQTSIGTLSAL